MVDDLQRLAPTVDVEQARTAFRRRRRRSRAVRRGVMGAAAVVLLTVGTVGVLSMAEDEAPVETGPSTSTPASTGPVTFEVLAVADATDEMGTLRSATNADDFEEVWRHADAESSPPEVDFDDQVVVSITIPDDACPPDLTAFDRDGEVITPVFVETAEPCQQPLIPKTYIVAIDRSSIGSSFTLRLPANPTYGYDEQRLAVVLDPSEISHGKPPTVWVQPASETDEGFAAMVGGTLGYDAVNDCLLLEGGGRSYPVVWPAGTVGTAEGPGVVLSSGEVVRVGYLISGGGGFVDVSDRYEIPGGCASPEGDAAVFNANAQVVVEAAGTGVQQDVGRVAGTFIASGGPFGAADTPMSGTVTATSADGDTTTVAAAGGEFELELPSGTYTLTGVSPQYQASDATCRTSAPVQVTADETVDVVVGCPRR